MPTTPSGSPQNAPHVVLVTSNLMGSSRVSGVVRGNGLAFQAARSIEQMEALSLDAVRAVLVDLETMIDLVALMQLLPPSIAKVAYGPHVDTTRLQQAADAGWDVMTRGEFDRALPQLAAQLAEPA